MVYVLVAFLIGLSWALWFILQLPLWVPLVASGALVLLAVVHLIVRFVHGRRAAGALERALAQQGEQQMRDARPERRAEIQALQKQISDGVQALKASRLGSKRGTAALYALPWYAIIGPPGAGKTTALLHSGLTFPYANSAVKGVGGTRNCDWWFTNDAILLDTAGRYATEQDDQAEWLAFLDLLRKYRTGKPLNGLIVAVPAPDILDADDARIEQMARTLRARIDEVMTRLRMVLPVYFLVTKADLIGGFVEFFGSFRRSERAQAWGATFKLTEDRADPAALVARELDVLVKHLHARTVRRLAEERDWRAREAIFRFPLELSGIRHNLQELMRQLFAVNAFQGTPTLRGFYFSSGTQEGTPLNRALQRMGQAMGIRTQQSNMAPQLEPKSYFLHDVFTKVLFPDAPIAASSATEQRRRRLVRVGVSGSALALALTLALPSVASYFGNRDLLKDSQTRASQAAKIVWDDGKPVGSKLEVLDPLLARLRELDEHEQSGTPFGLGFFMYQGDQLRSPLVRVFIANMQAGFVKRCRFALEERLRKVKGEQYYEERLLLKQYLMLSDVEHLDVDWATGKFVSLWSELEKGSTELALVDLRKRMTPHVRYYFELIKPLPGGKPRATAVAANEQVVGEAREVLRSVPMNRRHYALFVDVLDYQLWDPAGERIPGNMQYPGLTLKDVFGSRPEVLNWLSSRKHKQEKKWYRVGGPYTDWGHYAVLANLQNAEALLRDEAWVIPLSKEESGSGLAESLERVAKDYEQRYIDSWDGFMGDLEVQVPANLTAAVEQYRQMQEPPRPYLNLLRALEDHSQWTRKVDSMETEALEKMGERKAESYLRSRLGGLRIDVDLKQIVGRLSRVPGHFKKTVEFGVPRPGAAPGSLPLDLYLDDLDRLRVTMRDTLQDQPEASAEQLSRQIGESAGRARALLQQTDDVGRNLLGPLIERPLQVGGRTY